VDLKVLRAQINLPNQSGGDATITDVDPFTTSIKLEQTLLDYGRDLTLEKKYYCIRFSQIKID
jgi:outer membrane protein